jgi:hypothetical protein
MTREDRRLLNAYNNVLRFDRRLLESLCRLGEIASERLGYEVVADICGGGEIEFRIVLEDGVADHNSTIQLEGIIQNS